MRLRRRASPGAFGAPGKLQGPLALHTARIAVAPGPVEKAKALLDRGLVILTEAGRTDEAEADFSAALDLDPRNVDVMAAFERLCERTQRWDELGHRLEQKAVDAARPPGASRLWYGVGRVSERLDDLPTARAAYERSASLDPNLVEPVIALRRLASRRADWGEVARLLDLELALGAPGAGNPTRLVELASIVGERLGDNARALALLERARAVESSDPAALDLLFRFALASEDPAKRKWELAAQALERLLAGGRRGPRRRRPLLPRRLRRRGGRPPRRGAGLSSRAPIRATRITARRWSGCRSSASRRGSGTTPGAPPRRCSIVIARR